MAITTSKKTRDSTVEDLNQSVENNKQSSSFKIGAELSVRESQCQIQSTPNRPNKPLNFIKNETSFSRKSTLSNAVTCFTTNSVVSRKGSNQGFLQAFKQNNSFSRSSGGTNNQSSLCRIGTPSTNNRDPNSQASKNYTSQNSSESNAYSPQRKAPQQFKLEVSSQPPSSIAKEAMNEV